MTKVGIGKEGSDLNPSIEERGDKVTQVVEIVDEDGNQITSFGGGTEIQDTLDTYKISDIDADASPNYYGFLRKDGAWYIIKETISAGANTYRYVKGASGYDWSNRTSKIYVVFNSAF